MSNSKRVRVMVVFLISLFLFMSIAGCSGDSNKQTSQNNSDAGEKTVESNSDSNFNETGFPIVKNKITLKMAAPRRSLVKPFDELPFFKKMEEVTNVKIEWYTPDRDTEWEEKKNLMIASNDLPDAFYKGLNFSDLDLLSYGSQGIFIPLEEYIEKYGDNIKTLFEQKPEYAKAVVAPDGHIYALPQFEEGVPLTVATFFMNTTWLKKLNLKVPETPDDFYEVLKAFKEKDPNGNNKQDEIPFGFKSLYDVAGIAKMFGAFGILDNENKLVIKDNKLIFTANQPEYKEAIKYYHKLFAEGLVDKEALTHDEGVYLSKVRNKEQIYGSFLAWSEEYCFGEDNPDYEAILPLKAPDGSRLWEWAPPYFTKTGFIITKACKYPEVAFRWGDYQYDPLIGLQAGLGTIGEMIKQNEDGTLEYLPTPEGKTFDEWRGENCPGVSALNVLYDDIMRKLQPSEDFIEKFKLDEFYKDCIKHEVFSSSLVYMTAEESEKLTILQTDIKTYVDQMTAKWLLNGGIEDEWDAYVKKLQEMGIDEMMKIYNNVYSRMKN